MEKLILKQDIKKKKIGALFIVVKGCEGRPQLK